MRFRSSLFFALFICSVMLTSLVATSAKGLNSFSETQIKSRNHYKNIHDTNLLKIPAEATVLTLSGLNFNLYNDMPQKFKGIFAASPYKMKQIKYPASIAKNSIDKGVQLLDEALKNTSGQIIVLAHSQGAQVCSRWMREHAKDSLAPEATRLLFILSGNPLRSSGGYIIGRKEVDGKTGVATPTDTPWPIIDVARRYDGWADWVQDENNKVAVTNARKGKQMLHKQYDEVDLYSPAHTIWKKGNTTYVLTEEKLPPVAKGKKLSESKLAELRKQIENGYTNRPE